MEQPFFRHRGASSGPCSWSSAATSSSWASCFARASPPDSPLGEPCTPGEGFCPPPLKPVEQILAGRLLWHAGLRRAKASSSGTARPPPSLSLPIRTSSSRRYPWRNHLPAPELHQAGHAVQDVQGGLSFAPFKDAAMDKLRVRGRKPADWEERFTNREQEPLRPSDSAPSLASPPPLLRCIGASGASGPRWPASFGTWTSGGCAGLGIARSSSSRRLWQGCRCCSGGAQNGARGKEGAANGGKLFANESRKKADLKSFCCQEQKV